jgi:hypothetical protein
MKKRHMADKNGKALCEWYKGVGSSKMILVAERKDVTCKKCLKELASASVSTLLPDGK